MERISRDLPDCYINELSLFMERGNKEITIKLAFESQKVEKAVYTAGENDFSANTFKTFLKVEVKVFVVFNEAKCDYKNRQVDCRVGIAQLGFNSFGDGVASSVRLQKNVLLLFYTTLLAVQSS